jgi:hypothetical protein
VDENQVRPQARGAELSGMERDNRRVLSVSAAPAVVAAIEETIKRLDVPPPPIKSVEIAAYVLECSSSGDAGSLPQDLQGVLVQLKKTFNYSGCGLARTLLARGSDGSRFAAEFNERTAGRYELNGRVEVDSSEIGEGPDRGPHREGRAVGRPRVRAPRQPSRPQHSFQDESPAER